MAEHIPEALQKKLSARLSFYEDIGIELFYRDRRAIAVTETASIAEPHAAVSVATPELSKEMTLPKPVAKSAPPKFVPPPAPPAAKFVPLPTAPSESLFDSVDKVVDKSLVQIREDLGECTRCKLHRTRHTIVFGDGNPKAELVFVGEGPGADEDAQGLPFVGRAGKLLTQMIEAMGLQRKDVYICNVVKCRPPENRQPEEDEVKACSPFLFRQIDFIAPKVVVCLGATAAKTLLQTNRGITQFRGEWLEFRGRKLMCTYHPAYLLRNPPAKSEVWKDLQKVMAELRLEVKKGKSTTPDRSA
jgi:uracil-DNA glycosylase